MAKKKIEVKDAQDIKCLEWDYSEAQIQHTCKMWFNATFPDIADLLFAAENGGFRTPKAAAMAKYEGMVSGAPDFVLFPTKYNTMALGIEMKRPRKPANKQFGIRGREPGMQSEEQKRWEELCKANNGDYKVCRGLIEFVKIICEHLWFSKEEGEKYILDAINRYNEWR